MIKYTIIALTAATLLFSCGGDKVNDDISTDLIENSNWRIILLILRLNQGHQQAPPSNFTPGMCSPTWSQALITAL